MTNNSDHIFSNVDIRKLLIPIMLENLLASLMGTVDTMMVSNVGASAVSDPQSSLKLFLIVLGAGLLVYGLIRVAVGNKIAVCRATGKVLKKYELLFESAEVSRLKQMVESGNFQSIDTLQRAVGHKAGAKLTLFIDADHNFATAQVSEFIPFDYEPVMSPMSYEGEAVKTIATLVTSGT